jgi:hypothetical protein
MISLEDFKALLGPLAATLTDEEIVELRTMEYQFADAVIEWWLRNGTSRRGHEEQRSDVIN